ncbi:MAG: translation initiation factor IF-2, partial [Gammaproteobacteria bacterium]|nr:translation initiation factor IF-2 [Gammaproteobacteria bacterium]
MSQVTIAQFAEVVKIPADRLLEQLANAGVTKNSIEDIISDEEKRNLLGFLRQSHGTGNRVTPKAKVTLKRKSTSTLKMGGARTSGAKSVNVEVRKKRTLNRPNSAAPVVAASTTPLSEADEQVRATRQNREEEEQKLLQQDEERRQHQLKKNEEEVRVKEEAERRQEEEIKRKTRESEERRLLDEQARQVAEKAAAKKREEEKAGGDKRGAGKRGDNKQPTRYGRKELHVAKGKSGRKNQKRNSRRHKVEIESEHGFTKPTAPVTIEVQVPETITIGDLAQKMSTKAAELIKVMMNLGTMATINQMIDQETAALLVEEMGHKAVLMKENALEDELLADEEHQGERKQRAPVVTIMGHVDHGKTSLLDHIRETRITQGEAGGITQHIGAYRVTTKKGDIAFLDTPGHAAFTAMRARGAKVTDIVVLVVAADDGVMPQTEEAIQHAKAAKVPLIVAVNKIDKPDADPDRVKTELAGKEVVPDDWGGDVMFANVSAHTGEGVDGLLDAILLQAELLELTAVADAAAKGNVVESRIDKGRGAVATVMVQSGTLRKGDILLAGREYGRVRAMTNEHGEQLSEAGSSTPVEILGLSGVPEAGEEAVVVPSERKAREVANFRQGKYRDVRLAQQKQASLDRMFEQMQEGQVSTVNILIKADVNGSAEALSDSLNKLTTEEVKVNVISSGVGGINESDANLAIASNAIVIGFNVRADSSAKKLIEAEGIDLHYYSVIYDAIEEVKRA